MKFWIMCFVAFAISSCLFTCTSIDKECLPSKQVLELHSQYSSFTDPGLFEYLYTDLPSSIEGLCTLVKRQLIHPFEVTRFHDQIPVDRVYENQEFPTVEEMLEELLRRDPSGLTLERKPGDRLVVACVHHSMLLASILRHRGIPVRIRSGFAKYIGGDRSIRVSHAICEVWDVDTKRWILVDPDRQRVDLPRSEFELASSVWLKLRDGQLQEDRYISRYESTARATLHLLCHDLSYVLGEEEAYWLDPPVVFELELYVSDIETSKLAVLDRIADLLEKPDNHISELTQIQSAHSFLQY